MPSAPRRPGQAAGQWKGLDRHMPHDAALAVVSLGTCRAGDCKCGGISRKAAGWRCLLMVKTRRELAASAPGHQFLHRHSRRRLDLGDG